MTNDYDPDKDDVFFASATQPSTLSQYSATGVAISADRKTLILQLPAYFIGPAHVQYTVMDQNVSSVSSCLPPECRVSAVATAVIYGITGPPVAVSDAYTFVIGRVSPINVLSNDYAPDRQEVRITRVTPGTLSGLTPAIRQTCASCPGPCAGIANCNCTYDPEKLKCFPSNGHGEYFIDYTSQTGNCGKENFTYTIETNGGQATTTVTVNNIQCFCYVKNVGFSVVFLLDGTQSETDFGFQLSFADGVMRRSLQLSTFGYGIVEVGTARRIVNLSTSYFDTQLLRRSLRGNRNPYALGEALRAAKQMIDEWNRPTWNNYIVILTNRGASYDSVPGGLQGLAAKFFSVSIGSPLAVNPFLHTYFTNGLELTATSFVNLTQVGGPLQQEIMDFMCGA
jgi:hypothetical protein